MSSTDVVQRTPQQALMASVHGENFQRGLAAVLPENVTPAKFARVFGTALLANPDLAEADRDSVMQSLLRIAEMGLMPDGREAAIVTFYSKKKQANVAQALAMIAGVRRQFAEHGWTLRTQVVYSNDEFEFTLAPVERVTKHDRSRPGHDPGALVYAYAVARHRDGREEWKIVDADDIAKARAVSRATGPGTPWVEWESRMWEKTAGHALARQIGLAESDRMVAIFAPPPSPEDAAKQLYGPNGAAALAPGETVDRSTGEISSPGEVVGSGADDVTQQAEAASTPSGVASAPEPDDDPEPVAAVAVAEGGDAVIPGGAYEGRTLAQVAALGAEGEEYLAWMARNAGRSSVGPAAHAALQKFRPALFEAKS